MPGALGHSDRFLGGGADFFHLVEGGAGDYKGERCLSCFFQNGLPPEGQTVAVHRYHRELFVLQFKESAGVNGAGFVVADGKNGLSDHGFELFLWNLEGILVFHRRELGEFFGVGAQNVEFAQAAFDVDHVVFGGKDDDVVGEFADDFAEEAGAENKGAGGFDFGGDGGADAGLQIVAGQAQFVVGLQQDTFQSWDGAFWRHSAGGGIDSILEKGFFAGKFHGLNSSVWVLLTSDGEKRRG